MNETCDLCGEVFGNVASLMEHRQATHAHDDPASDVEVNPEAHTPGVRCALCGHRFPTAASLAQHNLRPHSPPTAPPVRGRSPA